MAVTANYSTMKMLGEITVREICKGEPPFYGKHAFNTENSILASTISQSPRL